MYYEPEVITFVPWDDKVILIAEDEEVNYKFLEAVLRKSHAKILRAKNGLEALDLCKNVKSIDLILMDLRMPVMDGYEAANEIFKLRSDLPIIAQTAFTSDDELLKCKDSGFTDFVTKPIDIRKLIKKINSLFNLKSK